MRNMRLKEIKEYASKVKSLGKVKITEEDFQFLMKLSNEYLIFKEECSVMDKEIELKNNIIKAQEKMVLRLARKVSDLESALAEYSYQDSYGEMPSDSYVEEDRGELARKKLKGSRFE